MFPRLLTGISLIFISESLLAQAQTYGLTDNWIGSAFWSAFEWQAIADPTNGRVYVPYLFHGSLLYSQSSLIFRP